MPSWADAVVDAAKIVDYLLSAEHPIGADKATFFIAIGYRGASGHDYVMTSRNCPARGRWWQRNQHPLGSSTLWMGVVRTPTGRIVELRTVWICDDPDDPPRLVTAYPR